MNKDELKQFREGIGLTQGELSKALGVANNTVSRWELGTRSIPEFLPLALETIKRRYSKTLREIIVPASNEVVAVKDLMVNLGLVENQAKALELLKNGSVVISGIRTADKKTVTMLNDIILLEVEGLTHLIIAE